MDFYFGCHQRPGHFFWTNRMNRVSIADGPIGPWGYDVDGKLSPSHGEQSVAAVHHKNGWTALAMNDRSQDSRPNSHSVFLSEGNLTFEQMLDIARRKFPKIVHRIELAAPIVLDNP